MKKIKFSSTLNELVVLAYSSISSLGVLIKLDMKWCQNRYIDTKFYTYKKRC